MKTTAKWILVAVAMMAQQKAIAQQRDVSVLQDPEPLGSTVAWSVGAGFIDLSLRAAEGVGEVGLGLVSFENGFTFGTPPRNAGLATAAFVGGGVLLLAMPAVNALVLANVGDRRVHHPFVPLLITSYLTNLPVDVVTIALLGTSWGAPLAFLVGSLAGSATMGVVYGVTTKPVASAAPAVAMPDLTHGPVIPTAVPQSTVLTF